MLKFTKRARGVRLGAIAAVVAVAATACAPVQDGVMHSGENAEYKIDLASDGGLDTDETSDDDDECAPDIGYIEKAKFAGHEKSLHMAGIIDFPEAPEGGIGGVGGILRADAEGLGGVAEALGATEADVEAVIAAANADAGLQKDGEGRGGPLSLFKLDMALAHPDVLAIEEFRSYIVGSFLRTQIHLVNIGDSTVTVPMSVRDEYNTKRGPATVLAGEPNRWVTASVADRVEKDGHKGPASAVTSVFAGPNATVRPAVATGAACHSEPSCFDLTQGESLEKDILVCDLDGEGGVEAVSAQMNVRVPAGEMRTVVLFHDMQRRDVIAVRSAERFNDTAWVKQRLMNFSLTGLLFEIVEGGGADLLSQNDVDFRELSDAYLGTVVNWQFVTRPVSVRDTDGDNWDDNHDNCVFTFNPDQDPAACAGQANGWVSGSLSVSTGDAPSEDDPVTVSVIGAGNYSGNAIVDVTDGDGDVTDVALTLPSGTSTAPWVVTVSVHDSVAAPSVTAGGVAVPACTTTGVAAPSPCVEGTPMVGAGGETILTVLTTGSTAFEVG